MYIEIIKFKNFIVLIKANDEYLISVDITNLATLKEKPNQITSLVKSELLKYFKGEDFDFTNIKLNLDKFSTFTKEVLNELKNIPYANTITYKELAYRINSKAYRAVGTALSKNPYLIILPCHRVIRSDESLGRFTCEVSNMKEFLNKHEKNNIKSNNF
ncbi:methylated-DNA--[protein]-cysteine S-methyltransferase [Campylobacter sp. RM9334]|uniref:methylated-DNA--[protein]-cysteine S-methyltransferase n=1 Tax=unclassified Campylobacter TaxID=2593542 RepID=UPI001D858B5C|nr:methylated-DNA--[protein]-cysteine S-methyltransferase [Campylobacter sp. RM12651]MBZ7978325.1 methylated-DNA--[protein]-cysteine S-methyltransferase [Campylobacter sp. RM12654]MBZ7984015.1 methylated-DNA--[protein]-cysteine S-methyltransferase [Campylobacter sp. RM12647]MBZ8007854.1 methylated-DNA--[protein]-cysteine S-methyltransferase [Campylobacter sp. RM9334]ULO03118.1 O6-alkylguanine-DNA-alkyltransferase [Campylobacter sp. RM12651]